MTHNSESKHSKYIKPSWIQGSYCFILYSYGEAPAPNQVEEFKRVCSHFFEQHPGDIIGDGTIIVSENILIDCLYEVQESIVLMGTTGLDF